MDFGYERVADIQEVRQNNYILQSGHGVTQLVTKVLYDTIDTIISNPGKIDKLIIILDAEEIDAEDRKRKVYEQIRGKYEVSQIEFDVEVLVCNHCFETWLLGCCGLYPKEAIDKTSDFYQYYINYNIEECDPEEMVPPENNTDTIAKYHFHYLHEILRYKKIRYSKSKPANVATERYFNGIVKRINTTEHLKSFQVFYDFIFSVKKR